MADSVLPHSVGPAVQALLQASDEPGGVASLIKQVSMATAVLPQNPGLYRVALGVLASAYHSHAHQPEQVGGADRGLAVALVQAEEVIASLLDHAPHTWSHRVLQWCVDVVSGASRQVGARGSALSLPLEDSLRLWLQHPNLVGVVRFLDQCAQYMVCAGRGGECMEVVMRECVNHAPQLNWLLAHVVSQQPAELLPPLLERALSLPHPPLSPPFTAVGQTLEFLGHSSRAVVGQCVLEVVGKVVRGEGGKGAGWGRRVELLLRLAPLCEGLLSSISHECLQIVTAEKIKAIVIAASRAENETHDSHMTSDEDEGEVRSDEEGAVEGGAADTRPSDSRSSGGVLSAVVEVLGVLGEEAAAQAITQLVQTHSLLADLAQSQEDAMEEGEIVRVSLVDVVREGCEAIMTQLLQRLHVAAMVHLTLGPRGARGAGGEGEFAVGLQCGLQRWSLILIGPNLEAKCRQWLQAAVASVCVCASELQAAQALATMLLHCQHAEHLGQALRVYGEVSVRHSRLSHSAMRAALALCREGAGPGWLCDNLWRITVDRDSAVGQSTRSKFIAAASECLLPLSALLCEHCEVGGGGEGGEVGVWRVLEVMGEVEGLGEGGGDYSTHCRVLANLLSFYFSCLAGAADRLGQGAAEAVGKEVCLGRCAVLAAGWVGPAGASQGCREPLRMFFLTSLIARALSQDVSECFGSVSQVKGPVEGPRRKVGDLLPTNQTLALGASHASSARSGSLQHSHPPARSQSDPHETSSTHATNHILHLLGAVAGDRGDLVMSVLLDHVAPHLPPDSAPWLPGDGTRSTSLEWSLSVKRRFDQHPLLWQLLLFSVHSGCGFCQCEPVVCSLLLVLTQHWFSCRFSGGVASGRERDSSERLVEALAAAGWLPEPLSCCAELFQSVRPHDVHLLLSAISTFIKTNLQELRRGALAQLKDTGYRDVLKAVLVRNIHKLGNLYAHYII